jgi:hypothetical protein
VKDKEEIKQVATVSANWDTAVGQIIADAMEKVGKDGTAAPGVAEKQQVNALRDTTRRSISPLHQRTGGPSPQLGYARSTIAGPPSRDESLESRGNRA